MSLNSLYFRLKPVIPRACRLTVRRWIAARKRQHSEDVWPILPGSDRAPRHWPGWPGKKKFAFVVTHDVEGKRGVDNCYKLAQLERRLGFRSSFNFVPEGSYSVPSELRRWLGDRGFEVGVHDLHHDGRLYSSREEFNRKARRINEVLKEWNAVGFRSGYMLRNLDWISELNIAYDASTFDTDPFEPQPDGVGTIFPFWVSRARTEETSNFRPAVLNPMDRGYVELPYTLPQDSTLFLILKEATIETWKRKIDWIAARGGMALVNVHPDYVRFADSAFDRHTYPVELFLELLRYVKERYGDSAWQALPSEVAAFFAKWRSRRTAGCIQRPPGPNITPRTSFSFGRDSSAVGYQFAGV